MERLRRSTTSRNAVQLAILMVANFLASEHGFWRVSLDLDRIGWHGTHVADESYDVFVSYPRADGRHATEIDSVLRAKGLKTFFEPVIHKPLDTEIPPKLSELQF